MELDYDVRWYECEELEGVSCPSSGASDNAAEAHQGDLGRISHYRCRFCGDWFYGSLNELM